MAPIRKPMAASLPRVRREENHDGQHDGHDADRAVLALQEGHGALLDGGRDLAHALIARGLSQNPEGQRDSVEHRQDTTN